MEALVAANGTLALPSDVTVAVTVKAPAVAGSYVLISAGAISSPVNWTLAVDAGSALGRSYALRSDGTTLVLDVREKGTSIIFK